MKSLNQILKALYEPFLSLDCPVYHYREYGEPEKYVVWTEDGENASLHADNHKHEQKITGYVHLYTKTEFDPLADDIQDILDAEGLSWVLMTVDFESETGFIHYRWMWEVV